MFLRPCLALCAVLALTTAAHADTNSYDLSSASVTTDVLSTTSATATINGVPEFDTSLGTLNSITIDFYAYFTVGFTGNNGSGNTISFTSVLFGNSDVVAGSAGGGIFSSGTFGDAGVDFIGTADTDATDLAYMEGTGTQDLTMIFSGTNLTSLTFNALYPEDYGSPTIIYDYTPASSPTVTPEPSSLALLGTGLLGIVGVARKRLKLG